MALQIFQNINNELNNLIESINQNLISSNNIRLRLQHIQSQFNDLYTANINLKEAHRVIILVNEDFQKEIYQLKNDIEKLKNEKQELINENDKLKRDVNEKSQKIEELKAQITSSNIQFNSNLTNIMSNSSNLRNENEQLIQDIMQSRSERTNQTREIERLTQLNNKMSKQIEDLERDLNNKRHTINQMENEKQTTEATILLRLREISQITSEKERLMSTINSLRSENSFLKFKVRETEDIMKLLFERIDRTEDKLKKAQNCNCNSITNLTFQRNLEEINYLKADNERLRLENNYLKTQIFSNIPMKTCTFLKTMFNDAYKALAICVVVLIILLAIWNGFGWLSDIISRCCFS